MKTLLVLISFLLIIATGCKKNSVIQNPELENKFSTLIEVKKSIMEKIIFIAKNNPEFKKAVEEECLKQVRGDYNVALERLIQIDQQTPILPESERKTFISLVKQMKDFRPNEIPIIFVPVMESRDPKELSKSSNKNDKKSFIDSNNSNNPNNYITMVDQDDEVGKVLSDQDNAEYNMRSLGTNGVYACASGYLMGYIISDAGVITPRTCVSEAMAWNTDVWVLGYEEVVSPGNRVASAFDGGPGGALRKSNSNEIQNNELARVEGWVDYGGRIQVTDLGSIESWARGKPEFYHYVYNSTGTLIHEHAYGKLKRSHFNNNQWTNLRCNIGSWNTSVWGTITYEKWKEEDGGDSSPTTFSVNYVLNGISYSVAVTSPAKSKDENLGFANVQFNDPTALQVPYQYGMGPFKYTYNYMNMQREN